MRVLEVFNCCSVRVFFAIHWKVALHVLRVFIGMLRSFQSRLSARQRSDIIYNQFLNLEDAFYMFMALVQSLVLRAFQE